MFYKREGFPEEDEIVFCTVTKIMHSSVFVVLDEFDKSGLINISEIAPGRIRNIRDYVTQGKKIVCKILRVDQQKGHIDLSLRRVTEMERKKKVDEIRQEQKAEKIIELAAKELKKPFEEIYDQVADLVFQNHTYLFHFFREIGEGKTEMESLKLNKKLAEVLQKMISEKFKPTKVTISGVFELKSYAPDGVEVIKKALTEANKDKIMSIGYIGGGRYKLRIEADDYKAAEKILARVESNILSFVRQNQGEGSFKRD